MGLGFAGIDLKITPDDEIYCFEVNPSPAFSYYESNTGQRISEGVAAALTQSERSELATCREHREHYALAPITRKWL
jgi:glutathione synthase/RimK-type ligase-like ATP-grasp enzyme